MSDNFFSNLKFTIPSALIAWALFVWLVLATFDGDAAEIDTPSEMAKTALHEAMALPHASSVEYAGVVIAQADGGYRATEPQRCEEASFKLIVKLALGEKIAAIYHTHPGAGSDSWADRPSAQDREMARKLHVPSYIGIIRLNHIVEVL